MAPSVDDVPSPVIVCAIALVLVATPPIGPRNDGCSISATGKVLVAVREDCGAGNAGGLLCDGSCDITVGVVALVEILGATEVKGACVSGEAAGTAALAGEEAISRRGKSLFEKVASDENNDVKMYCEDEAARGVGSESLAGQSIRVAIRWEDFAEAGTTSSMCKLAFEQTHPSLAFTVGASSLLQSHDCFRLSSGHTDIASAHRRRLSAG